VNDPMEIDLDKEDTCECGHAMGPHRLLGYPDEQVGMPVSGWMQCPECDCVKTWEISPEMLQAVRNATNGN
jgi:hypothetical protein